MFFGTPESAVPSLDALLTAGIDVSAVVTNPDRPAGRGLRLTPSPVKRRAVAEGIEVLQPESARDPGLTVALGEFDPDVVVVVAYGQILPARLLGGPRLGFVNVHFSLLPAYRGAAPVQRAIIDGRSSTGVTIMVLTEAMDEGPVLAQEPAPIEPGDSAGTVGDRLAGIGGRLLIETLSGYDSGALTPRDQDHERATYAPKITTEEARIDWRLPARRIQDLIRGLDPAPGAWTTLGGRRLKVFGACRNGSALGAGERGPGPELVVGTGDAALQLEDVQPAGKRRMGGVELVRGLRAGSSDRFE